MAEASRAASKVEVPVVPQVDAKAVADAVLKAYRAKVMSMQLKFR